MEQEEATPAPVEMTVKPEPWIKRTASKAWNGVKKHKKAVVTGVAVVGGVLGALFTLDALARKDKAAEETGDETDDFSDLEQEEDIPDEPSEPEGSTAESPAE